MFKTSLLFFALVFFFLFEIESKEEIKKEDIERAMLHIAKDGIPSFRIGFNKKNVILKQPEKRRKLVEAIYLANKKYPNVLPSALIVLSFRESSFKNDVIGGIGETGTFQIAPKTKNRIKKKLDKECTTETYYGAAICAASFFNHCLEKCGNIKGAYLLFATGKKCKPWTKKQEWLIRDRTRLTSYLSKYLEN